MVKARRVVVRRVVLAGFMMSAYLEMNCSRMRDRVTQMRETIGILEVCVNHRRTTVKGCGGGREEQHTKEYTYRCAVSS